jgi:S-DNA-T family DNA segregation ATPase FtsK/SpoIIIE
VAEMNGRYKKFASLGVRDLEGYNEKVSKGEFGTSKEEIIMHKLPQIVIIVDELADLMMVAQNEVEDAIMHLTQMARAAGLHLIIATQRPSVNVITGVIKANVPSRIAFAVSSQVDSRTILDGAGAEKLLGKGDMLFFPSSYPKPVRVQGTFVSDNEVSAVVDFLKENDENTAPSSKAYEEMSAIADSKNNDDKNGNEGGGKSDNSNCGYDDYFEQAGRFIIEKNKASIGMLQRIYSIGFNRAARIMDQLTEKGVVGPEEGTKPRKILMDISQFNEMMAVMKSK